MGIHKVLHIVHPTTSIVKHAIIFINKLLTYLGYDIVKNALKYMHNKLLTYLGYDIVKNALKYMHNEHNKILTTKYIQRSVYYILDQILGKYAVEEGKRAQTKYINNNYLVKYTGLRFNIFQTKKLIKNIMLGNFFDKISPIYLAAVFEYICTELLELSTNITHDNKRSRITIAHIKTAISNDTCLIKIFGNYDCYKNA